MAVNWNDEYYIALEGRDLQANAMAVDNTGTYVLLAGRRYIAIRNLDEEGEVVQKFPRQSKYEVGAAEWNPTPQNRELCVISSNQRLEVLTWRSQELIQTHSLRAHTRVITDLNWHRSDPNILASCSVDTFIHIWDLRDARRPSLSLSAIAEASQVRWNRVSPHILATAHDGDIKVWDQRKGTAPVQYVAAHLSKIHGLDWNPNIETQFVTSSQDNTVKFFDTTNPRRADCVLTTNAPVWRARFTPFGNGLVTVVVPQLRRGENSLLLWNTANRSTPMHRFVGHRDVVLDFEWRKKRPGTADFQLITWSKDQTLLVWQIEPFLQKLCGHEPEDLREETATTTGTTDTVKMRKKVSPKVEPLQQEFSLLNVHISNLEVTKMDSENRTCTVNANVNNLMVNLQVVFPNAYPHGVPPVFQIMPDSTVTDSIGNQLLQTLNHLAQQRVSKNRTCLESCLRQMITSLEQLAADSENDRIFNTKPANVFGGYNDAYIPFPRTSGAKFCSVGILVCFGRPLYTRRISGKLESTTPRALSALETVYNKRSSNHMTVSGYYHQKQRFKAKHISNKAAAKALVHVYDVSGLLLANRQLAEEYILDGDVGTICKHNAASAAVVGRWDLVQAWTLAELVVCAQIEDDPAWTRHPFGNQLTEALISHYAAHSDIQMAAMLSCIFSKNRERTFRAPSSTQIFSPGSTSPYHTLKPITDSLIDGWGGPSRPPLLKTTRSTSLDNLKLEEVAKIISQKNATYSLYEYFKLSYAEILHRWGLIYNRAEVLKYRSTPPERHVGLEFATDCKKCLKPSKDCACIYKQYSLTCTICHLSVRGSANCCVACGHGGHTKHLQQWFEKRDVCPSGCGCRCLIETAEMFTV